MTNPPFHLVIESRPPDAITIRVAGDVDYSEARRIECSIGAAMDDGVREILFDLSEITFFGSAGLNALVTAKNRLDDVGGTLRLQNPSPMVRQLLSITGLEGVLVVDP